MGDMEKLMASLEKLRRNKENVPLDILETRYKTGYEKLKAQIKEELKNVVVPIAAKSPEWLGDRHAYKKEHAEKMIEIFHEIYTAGHYARRMGDAVYKHYSVAEAKTLAKEINEEYSKKLLEFFHEQTCLYATIDCFNQEDPRSLRIYNDFVDKFWDEGQGKWIEPAPENRQPAILIVAKEENEDGKETEKYETETRDEAIQPGADYK